MLGTPAIVLEGPHLAKAIILTSWQHHMDSVAEWSKGGGSRRHSVRVWVRAPLLSFLHTKQIGAGGPKPRHHSFLSASGCV